MIDNTIPTIISASARPHSFSHFMLLKQNIEILWRPVQCLKAETLVNCVVCLKNECKVWLGLASDN